MAKSTLFELAIFFKRGQRCTCQRKKTVGAYTDTESFQLEINKLHNNEYTVISEYINRKSPIKVRHKCGFEYELERAEALLDTRGHAGECPVCNSRMKNSIDRMNYKFEKNGLRY